MAGDKNIEEIFKTAFEQFQPEVDPSLWSGLESKLDQLTNVAASSSGATAVGATAGSGILKTVLIAAGIGIAAITTGIILYNLSESDEDLPLETSEKSAADQNQLKMDSDNKEVEKTIEVKRPENNGESLIDQKSEQNTEKKDKVTDRIESELPMMSWADSWLTSPGKTYYHDGQKSPVKGDTAKSSNSISKTIQSVPSQKTGAVSNSEVLKFEIINLKKEYAQGRIIDLTVIGTFSKYEWKFGDGTRYSGTKVSHVFSQTGETTMLVTAYNEAGEKLEQLYTFQVVEGPEVVVPNVFTPNGDGVNDFFIVEYRKLKSFTMIIVTLSGEEVVTITNPDEGWNGEIQGQPAPEGQYMVTVQAVGEDDVVLPIVRKVITLSRSRR